MAHGSPNRLSPHLNLQRNRGKDLPPDAGLVPGVGRCGRLFQGMGAKGATFVYG